MFNTHESADLLLDEIDTPDPDLDEGLEDDEKELDNDDAGELEEGM